METAAPAYVSSIPQNLGSNGMVGDELLDCTARTRVGDREAAQVRATGSPALTKACFFI